MAKDDAARVNYYAQIQDVPIELHLGKVPPPGSRWAKWEEANEPTRAAMIRGALAVQRHTLERLESAGVPGVGQLIGAMRGGKTLEEALQTRENAHVQRQRLVRGDAHLFAPMADLVDGQPVPCPSCNGAMSWGKAPGDTQYAWHCSGDGCNHKTYPLIKPTPRLDPDKMHGEAVAIKGEGTLKSCAGAEGDCG
jgi:hypothetical protein